MTAQVLHPIGADGAAMPASATEVWQRAGFALYVHWPFCAAKCPYCDFNSHVASAVDQARWRAALLRDLAYWAERTPGRVLGSIFFGGGTPSLMAPETVGAVVEAARRHWTPANDLEVTLEANPTSVETARFRGYVDAGVERFSIGVQALEDGALRALGRLHDAGQARRAVEMAMALTDRVSFDLIYARQGQTLVAWRAELGEALRMAGEHLSLYQLTVEEGTAFGARRAAGRLRGLPGEDLAADLFEATQDLCGAAGLPRYEVSNHARPDAACRHNLVYWRGGDWLGIGPGAHGRLGHGARRVATTAAPSPPAWLAANERTGTGTATESVLSPADCVDEYVLMALRTAEGVDLRRVAANGGALDDGAVTDLLEAGLLAMSDDALVATEAGILLLDAILPRILPPHA